MIEPGQHPTSLTVKWMDKILTVEDIIPKIREYAGQHRVNFNERNTESVSRQIYKAYLKYHDPNVYAGDFVREFANDSVKGAMAYADNVNQRGLIVWHYYFYNCVPGDWRERLK